MSMLCMLESCDDKMQLGAESKAEGYCYGELDSDRAPSLSRRGENITQYAARLYINVKGNVMIGIINFNIDIGGYSINAHYLDLIWCTVVVLQYYSSFVICSFLPIVGTLLPNPHQNPLKHPTHV